MEWFELYVTSGLRYAIQVIRKGAGKDLCLEVDGQTVDGRSPLPPNQGRKKFMSTS